MKGKTNIVKLCPLNKGWGLLKVGLVMALIDLKLLDNFKFIPVTE